MDTQSTFHKRVERGFFCFLLVLCACTAGNRADKEDIVAYVNKEPIFKTELKKCIALKARCEPGFELTQQSEQEQLDTLIEKKLIIQEAIDKGLARDEKFVDTIKTFWEQTLVREFIDFKKEEFQDLLFATEGEMKQYYENSRWRVTFRVVKNTDRRYISGLYARLSKNQVIKEVPAWQRLGPLAYDDMASDIFSVVFGMRPGEVKQIDDGEYHYLVQLMTKEPVNVKPFAEIKDDLKKRVIAMKEQRLFNEWLKGKKQAAKIKIIKQ